MKKALDQTVRELKREVNKKVLKVPEIEQKVLDATSNEPWGPHGTHMADIAQATRNYNDLQIIMTILWKRINDTGRNWRHVYKSLTILEYLVAHGSERVIDELKEHAYQISTLADFQYLDSSGRDQGLNVRRKSQALVALVNDKERIREVRQKASTNRDKYRGGSSTGGIYKPSSYHSTGGSYGGDRYDDDNYSNASRHGGRDDDRSREGDDRYQDEDRYGRDGDRYGRDGDRYGRDDERYRDDYNKEYDHDDGRYSSRRGDERQSEKYGNIDRNREQAYDDDDRHSSRSGGGRGDEYEQQDDRRADRKHVGARMPAPPSYEEALGGSDCGGEDQRDGGGLAAAVARASKASMGQTLNGGGGIITKAPSSSLKSDGFDEFDPRASAGLVPTLSTVLHGNNFLGQVESANTCEAFQPSVDLSSAASNVSDLFGNSGFPAAPVTTSSTSLQSLEGDFFGDSPFKAEAPAFSSDIMSVNQPPSFTSLAVSKVSPPPSFTSNIPVGGASPATFMPSEGSGFSAFVPTPSNQTSTISSIGNNIYGNDSFMAVGGVNGTNTISYANISAQLAPPHVNPVQAAGSWISQHSVAREVQFPAQPAAMPSSQLNFAQPAAVPTLQMNFAQSAAIAPQPSVLIASQGPQINNTSNAKALQKEKFEMKSTVWADTLSKGLIDLNIAGPKTNPLADIGIDFDLLRTERIKEERASSTRTSTTSMGKAMGSGSGIGLAGAGAIAPPPVPIMMNQVGMVSNMGIAPMGMSPMMGSGTGLMPMGANPGMVMRPAMGGMGMNPMMGMGMGMGMSGYPNSQQQYNGFR